MQHSSRLLYLTSLLGRCHLGTEGDLIKLPRCLWVVWPLPLDDVHQYFLNRIRTRTAQ